MTMNVRLRRYIGEGDDVEALIDDPDRDLTGPIRWTGFEDPREGFIVGCQVSHPPSAKGRTVLLRLTEKDRDDLLLLLRREASRARSAT